MNITNITLAGTEYPVAINLDLVTKIEAKGETLSTILSKIEELNVSTTIYMLSAMMRAAKEYDTYRRGKGLEPVCPEDFEPLSEEDIRMEFTYVNFVEDIFQKLQTAILELLKPSVEVKPSKKGKGATQAG